MNVKLLFITESLIKINVKVSSNHQASEVVKEDT